MTELVVARYTENLNWLRNLPASLTVTVYDKSGEESTFGGSIANGADAVIPLPNIGREAHTYLHHLVSRYDSLAEWTIFCQGKPFDHAFDFKKTLREFDNLPGMKSGNTKQFVWLGHLIDTDDKSGNRLFRPWSKNEDGRGLDLAGFHQTLFNTNGPELYTFVLGAQFIIHRDTIHRQSRHFYERALAISTTFPDAAHCFERTWDRVFGLSGIDSDWLAGRQTVYLKPMKKQTSADGN